MKKVFLAVMAMRLVVLCISADNKLVRKFNIYSNGKIVYSIDVRDVDSAKLEMKEIASYNVIAMSNYNEMGRVTGNGVYDEGSVATLTAVANEGYVFDSWNDGITDNPREITVTSDVVLVANFKLKSDESENPGDSKPDEDLGEDETCITEAEKATAIKISQPYQFEYWGDYKGNDGHNYLMTIESEGCGILGKENNEQGSNGYLASGSGYVVCIDFTAVYHEEYFPANGKYVITEDSYEPGTALAGYKEDWFIANGFQRPDGYTEEIWEYYGCLLYPVGDGELKTPALVKSGYAKFYGTYDDAEIYIRYILEDNSVISFYYKGEVKIAVIN